MSDDRWCEMLARAARPALRVGSARFATEWGDDVVAALAGLLRDERRRAGRMAMGVLWMRAIGDAFRAGRRERRQERARHASGSPFGDLGGDVRAAMRSMRRAPGFAATIVLTLAFGIGLASAVFAFADGYLFRPLPFGNPEELYVVRAPDQRGEALRASEAEALRASPVGHYGFAGGGPSPLGFGVLQLGGREVQVRFGSVGEGFDTVMRVPLALGRPFVPDDHRGIEPIPIWLRHAFWRREFGGDREILGRRFSVRAVGAGQPERLVQVEVVGVTDPTVTTFSVSFGRSNSLPDGFAPALPREPDSGNIITLATPFVRLPPGTSRERAEAEIGAALQAIRPLAGGPLRTVRLDPLSDEHGKAGRPTAVLLMTGAVLALGLVVVNLVHLLLGRGVARAAEVATRAALGASRWRVARLFLVESLVHGVAGVAGGLALARWLTVSLAANIPTRGADSGTLALVTMNFDARVVVFAVVVGVVVAVVGGLWPAWRASRVSLVAASRTSTGAGARVSPRLSRAILASEVAVSTVVLTGAVFAGIGIWRFLNQPLGYDMTDRFSVAFPAAPGSTGGAVDWIAVRAAVGGLDGVRAAAANVDELRRPITVGERVFERESALVFGVGSSSVEVMGLRVLAGRVPTPAEFAATAPVAVVDERFAALVTTSGSPVGESVDVGGVAHDVIGVIEHPRFSLTRETPPLVLVPATPTPEREAMAVWAPGLTEAALSERVATVLASMAPGFRPNVSARTFDRTFGDDIANVRFQSPIVIVLGLFAFSVAGIGLFGLVAYLVEQRTRDFGVRLALGARPGDIWRELARHSLTPAAVGLVAGLAGALALSRVMRAGMFGWESSAPLSMAAVAALTLVAALLAVVVPARRVLRIDPAIILRAD